MKIHTVPDGFILTRRLLGAPSGDRYRFFRQGAGGAAQADRTARSDQDVREKQNKGSGTHEGYSFCRTFAAFSSSSCALTLCIPTFPGRFRMLGGEYSKRFVSWKNSTTRSLSGYSRPLSHRGGSTLLWSTCQEVIPKHAGLPTALLKLSTTSPTCFHQCPPRTGNLCSHVKSRRSLPEDEARNIFVQIAQSLEYMHINNIIHRDIKLEVRHLFP